VRLFQFVASAKSARRDQRQRDAWAQLLEVDPTDLGARLSRIGAVYQLLTDARKEVEQLPVSVELYLRPFNALQTAFAVLNLDRPWGNISEQITDSVLSQLEFAAEAAARYSKRRRAKPDELHVLLKKVSELSEYAAKTDLEPRLRLLIVSHAELMREAVLMYRITGVDGLQAATE